MKDHFLLLAAACLDIVANLLMKKSESFQKKIYGIPGLVCVCLAFTLLTQVTSMDLSVAYTLWGGMAILGSTLGAWIFFRQRIRLQGWIGIALILLALICLEL
jgi:spermidine export protein MdtI